MCLLCGHLWPSPSSLFDTPGLILSPHSSPPFTHISGRKFGSAAWKWMREGPSPKETEQMTKSGNRKEAETSGWAWGQTRKTSWGTVPQPQVLVSHFPGLLAPSSPSSITPSPRWGHLWLPSTTSASKPRSLGPWLRLLTAIDFATWLQLFKSPIS